MVHLEPLCSCFKIILHHDPMHSRLNYDQIEAGFVAINRWIRSNSPLERRMYADEETELILFNPRELKPNLCINRVSSVNRLFIL